MTVNFVTKVVDNQRNTTGGYVLRLDLPFAPASGMKLKGGISTWLWETADGNELDPKIQETVYNIDEEQLYCLFEVNGPLASSRWTKIENLQTSCEFQQFETHKPKSKVPEEELELLMREVLPLFISDRHYITKIEKTYDRQQVEKIKKAIAECIDRKYTTNYQYLTTVSGDIVFACFGLKASELTASGARFLSGTDKEL